jgi:hypothetical protein
VRSEEINALGELAGDAAGGIASQVRDVHASIADRVFGALGPSAAPVHAVHDRVAARSYGAARLLSGAIVRGGAGVFSLTRANEHSLSETPAGRAVLGAINGAWGDRLHGRGSPLATSMELRCGGREVELSRDGLVRAFPGATRRWAVFVHGLGETDDAWRIHAARHIPYGDRLRSERGYTPLYVRFNTGRHISHNGRALAELLERLRLAWPVEVSEIALIGHSMGGLVSRSACHYAEERSWRDKVRHVFMLGAPHKGAPLELAANAACHALSLLPETRPFAAPIKLRSAGVKDLGYGYVVDEDWEGHDPDAFWHDTGTEIPFLTSANHYFVCATLSRAADAPLGRVVGDLLVLRASAWAHGGRGERMRFPVDQYAHLGGANHFDLLGHPAIYAQIERWLTLPAGLPSGSD